MALGVVDEVAEQALEAPQHARDEVRARGALVVGGGAGAVAMVGAACAFSEGLAWVLGERGRAVDRGR